MTISREPTTYTNWLGGGPSNDWGNEDAAVINSHTGVRGWNDVNAERFIVGIAEIHVVPEPISSALFLLGGGALGLHRIRRKRQLA